MTDSLRTEVLTIAQGQIKLSDDDLLALLQYEWERAGLASIDRGEGSDYLRRVAKDIGHQAIEERDNIEVMSAIVADKALGWAAQHGIALDQYALIIGLLVAWVIRAVLKDDGSDGTEI